MNSVFLREVKTAFNGPLWHFIEKQVESDVAELRKSASLYKIEQVADFAVREQMLMRANALENFIEQLPSQVDDRYKQLLQDENK